MLGRHKGLIVGTVRAEMLQAQAGSGKQDGSMIHETKLRICTAEASSCELCDDDGIVCYDIDTHDSFFKSSARDVASAVTLLSEGRDADQCLLS